MAVPLTNEGEEKTSVPGKKTLWWADRKWHILKPENSSPNQDSNPHSSFGGRLGRHVCSPLHQALGALLAVSYYVVSETEPGIRCGNEDCRGNENWKLRKNIFCVGKNWQAYFFLWKLRWWICECKLKVQNWYSSWILVCYISSNLPPECPKLHRL